MVLTLRGEAMLMLKPCRPCLATYLKTIYWGFLGFYTVLNPGLTAVNEILKGRQKSGLSLPFFFLCKIEVKIEHIDS